MFFSLSSFEPENLVSRDEFPQTESGMSRHLPHRHCFCDDFCFCYSRSLVSQLTGIITWRFLARNVLSPPLPVFDLAFPLLSSDLQSNVLAQASGLAVDAAGYP